MLANGDTLGTLPLGNELSDSYAFEYFRLNLRLSQVRSVGYAFGMARLSPRFLCIPFLVLLAVAASFAHGEQAPGAAAKGAPTLVVEGLGKAAVTLSGPWQFHVGDDMGWAQPDVDDATGHDGWETIGADKPWGQQSHYAYTGFAWYRRHVDLKPVAGAPANLALLVFPADGPYEVYWNGRLIGKVGEMPPNPEWGLRTPPHSFGMGAERSGVLAIRMWLAPPQFTSLGIGGGLGPAPVLGSGEAVSAALGKIDHEWLRDRQYYFDLNLLYGLLGILGFLAWMRNRTQELLPWVSLFAVTQPIHVLLFNSHMPIHFTFAWGFDHVVAALEDVSLWLMLLYLLELDGNLKLRRWTRILATVALAGGIVDWIAVNQNWSSPHVGLYQVADGASALLVKLLETFPVVLILFAIGKRLRLASWLVAISASVYAMISVIATASLQGERFTHWTALYYAMRYRVFTVNGNYFDWANIAAFVLLISIIFAVDSYSADQSKRQGVLEQEFKNAREVQRVLVPETPPAVPGFTLTSAYRPAQEVGGDFFQIIPLDNTTTLIVLGDVSGKGLRAAMAVSLIVGVVRMVAEANSSPAEILASLNRRLFVRLQGGFATCLVMRLDHGGRCAIASAGHPTPLLNGRELTVPGALPLGILAETSYAESDFTLAPGDYLALYTDGLLEARSAGGEIYGFERLESLFARKPGAVEAAEAAVRFGQEDDITVLTFRFAPTEALYA